MRFSLTLAYALAALLLGGAVAYAQEPDGNALLDAWRAQQRSQLEAASHLTFRLGVERRVEGAGGVLRQHVRAEADVRSALDVDRSEPRSQTAIRSLEVDGAVVQPDQYDRATHPLRRLLGPHTAWSERPMTLPYPLLRRASARDVVQESYNGRTVWRVTLDELPSEVDEATVWVSREAAAPRLLRSEVRLSQDGRPPPGRRPAGDRPPSGRRDGPPRGTPPPLRARLVLTTDYALVDGLDLPTEQTLDLVAQQRRRLRTFTILVEQRLMLQDVRVER